MVMGVLLTVFALALSGCAGKRAFGRGNKAAKQGDWDAAVVHYTRATSESPDRIEYRMALQRAMIELASARVKKAHEHLAAQELEKAMAELQAALEADPANQLARDQLKATREKIKKQEEMKQEAASFEERRARARQLLATEPQLEPASRAPINIKFSDTSLQNVFEALSQLSGINILFDEQFRDKRVTIDLVDVTFREALDKLVLINRLFYKVVDPSTLIIIPDNRQKRQQYEDLVLKTFYVTDAEVNTIANMLRTIVGIQRVQPNPELRSITIRATPDQVAVAQQILDSNDKQKAELILDIEILEVNRTKLLEFGLRAAEYQVALGFAPSGRIGDTGAIRLNRLASLDVSDFTMTLPGSATYRLFKSNSEARLLAAPKLRASEGKRAEMRLGQEVPIPVTSFVSQFGVPGGVPTTPVTSFQYRTVGLNVAITPKVSVDGIIALELVLETSTQLDTRTIGGIDLPVFGTRNITNTVHLRDGETNLIAGLIQTEDRKTISGLPGIADVPILNRIFSRSDRNFTETDVVFSITPKLIRAPLVSDSDLSPFPMGTEQVVTVPGLRSPIFDEPEPETPRPQEPGAPEAQPPASPPAGAEPSPAPAPGPPAAPGAPPAAPAQPPAGTPPAAPGAGAPISVLFSPPAPVVRVGEFFELALVAGGAVSLSSGEITITFDPTLFQVARVEPGPFLSIDGKEVNFAPVIEPGRITAAFSRRDDTTGLQGSGVLIRALLEARTAGPPATVSASGELMDATGARIPASFASATIVVQ